MLQRLTQNEGRYPSRETCIRLNNSLGNPVAAVGGGGHVNFWGAINSKGTGCFRICTENTSSDVYCGILENYLIPTVQLYQLKNNYIYQHDNSRYHVSRQTQTKIRELDIQCLEWPAKSSDLNVIEHLWSVIDDKLKARTMCSVKELSEALSTAWLSIKPELRKKLVFSMSNKVYECIERNGKSIHY
ncbi:unnamed protein product [Rotaria magnacalcarata]|uniref:Tc1-like transposase DDE domain-containing protein n=1 Tax=Rotaria magnacalcarata TaxID=392030 RepID=A0A8S2NM45_9BILA|nr:unnamed protein product [Rotaria magnacalcarata]